MSSAAAIDEPSPQRCTGDPNGESRAAGCSSCSAAERPSQHAELRRLILQGEVGQFESLRRELLDRYRHFIPSSARHHPIRVFDRSAWARIVQLVYGQDAAPAEVLGVFFPTPEYEGPYGIAPSVLLPRGATRHVVLHELVHAYTHPRFFAFVNANAEQRMLFLEAWTDILARRLGGGRVVLRYDGAVDEVELLGGAQPEQAERAVFQGDLLAAPGLWPPSTPGVRNLWEAWLERRDGGSTFERRPGERALAESDTPLAR